MVKVLSVLIKTCTYVRRGGRDEGQKSVWGGVKCTVLDRRRRHHRPFTINRMDGWMGGWMDGGGVRYGYLKLYRALSGITMMNISIYNRR